MINILIENLTDKPFSDSLIKSAVTASLNELNVKTACQVSITLCEDDYIHSLNKQFRGIDKATDVLSFPLLLFDEGVMAEGVGDYDGDELLLGDIVINVDRAKAQAIEFGHSFDRELGFLCVHSMLHLLGYDHEEKEDALKMRGLEEKILAFIKLNRGQSFENN